MKNWRIASLMLVIIVLVGCAVSEEEALELGRQAYLDSIGEEPVEPNYEREDIRIFLPNDFEVQEKIDYNILLRQGDQLYNLFFQPSELSSSSFHFERDQELAGRSIIYEMNELDDTLSYLIIEKREEDEQYHVITASGGARITTVTSYQNLEQNIQAMTSIVQSYQVENG
ncbi:hypothetical protein [Halalkalibacter krulwichiae]|nr:hypothetical protein [Halalkalibacter krulwichiae]